MVAASEMSSSVLLKAMASVAGIIKSARYALPQTVGAYEWQGRSCSSGAGTSADGTVLEIRGGTDEMGKKTAAIRPTTTTSHIWFV